MNQKIFTCLLVGFIFLNKGAFAIVINREEIKSPILILNNFPKKTKVVTLTPSFGFQYANKKYYEGNLSILPGIEYFWMYNTSIGVKIGPEFHIRQSGNNHHFHFGTTEELFVRKYFRIGNKRMNKALFVSPGANFTLRRNHYFDKNTQQHSKEYEAHFKPYTDFGITYFINKRFTLNGAIRINYRYDSYGSKINFNANPDLEMGYQFSVNYFLR